MAGHVSLVFMRITSTTASNCVIRRMEAVAPNATYSLQFEGPSFKCEEARCSILNFIRTTGKVLKTETITTPDGEVLFFVATATPDYKAGDYYNVQYMGSGDYYGDGKDFDMSSWNFSGIAESCFGGLSSCPYNPQPSGTLASFPLLMQTPNETLACSLRDTTYNVSFRLATDIQSTIQPYNFTWRKPAKFTVYHMPT
ncbi:hypothetical protein BFJ69_g13284 [Fusarium oxysporum]|uniref:Uncharacterized protein n=1 Tax=Fusarium oxysporum TaxID=5507 RepID=A0A420ML90_FUSOX|nr:hypothetical protein BFJ69_g13284 [Fusarium oxysporum]